MNLAVSYKKSTKQSGIVSIVVTLILILVITLLIISFGKISRREQRSALDRQLSTQAFYAAESGINDARRVVEAWATSGDSRLITYNTTCAGVGSFAEAATPALIPINTLISATTGAAYTCIFVDPTVPEIITTQSSSQQIFPIKYGSPSAISNLQIYWDNGVVGGAFGTCPDVSTNLNSVSYTGCDAPILRIEIVDAANLTSSKEFFIYPHASINDTISYASTTGSVARGNCGSAGSDRNCQITLTGLLGTSYYMRFKGFYRDLALNIKPNTTSDRFVGAQTLIDVTGKAQDVLRRIQVRLKSGAVTNNAPLYGLEGTDKICKKFSIDGSVALDSGSCWASPTIPD